MAKRGRRQDFRKRHQGRVRDRGLTRRFRSGDNDALADEVHGERLSGKGELTRKRTVSDVEVPAQESDSETDLISGRVLSVHGLKSQVLAEDGRTFSCAVRQLLKSLSIDGRTAVVAGDEVKVRADNVHDAMIWQVAPRRGVISRSSRGQQHILAANVDHLLIIASLAQPGIKPALIDRFLLTAAQCNIEPILVLNKADLADLATVQTLIGDFATLGYRVVATSAATGQNIDLLRHLLRGRQTALAGQSGVGKSSLLNAVDPGLGLKVGRISAENEKGRHTTTATKLIPLAGGGAVFDTPGIRQFQLWDIAAEEVAGLMPDFRPYVSACRFPNCLHLAEHDCAVKNAVADGWISDRRYDTYCHLLEGDLLLAD
ncbi:MAG: ribosome small subunit-dependent GTPase A [Planctomycetota bacterium]